MPVGTLEVLVVSARGLDNTDFLSKMDPYVILTCKSQQKKSSTKSGAGSNPEWNETFLFTISGGASELRLRIMDKDTMTADDFVGELTIPLDAVFCQGRIPPMSYNVTKHGRYYGEIKVGLAFTPEHAGYPQQTYPQQTYPQQTYPPQGFHGQQGSNGGWNQSYRDY